MPKDISLFAAGEGGEDPVNSLLRLAAGDDDSESTDGEAVAGASESKSPSRPKKYLYYPMHKQIHVLTSDQARVRKPSARARGHDQEAIRRSQGADVQHLAVRGKHAHRRSESERAETAPPPET